MFLEGILSYVKTRHDTALAQIATARDARHLKASSTPVCK